MPQFGVSPLSTTTLGANQFPVGECFVPGTANGDLTSLEGILINTDGSGYKSSALRVGLKDGDDVTLGLTTQTKATDGSATSWSVIQLLKGTLDKLINGNVPVSGTFWQVTQPVSGTFWQATQPVSVASLPALPANQSINVAQLAGTATDTNSGVKSAGTLRVVLATDQPALTNKLLVTPDSVALPANQSVNVNQIGGTNIVTGGVAGLMAVGGPVASGASNADNPIKVGGVFNTTQPTVTNGQVVDAQMTARGARIVATGVDTFNATINAALPAGTNVIGHVIADSGSTTAATQATASNLNAQVVGNVASAAADSGNPVKVGGVFNSTPITLTNGQRGDLQLDANGFLAVNIKAGAGSGGFAAADSASWTAGSTNVEPIGGVFNDSATALTSGQEGTIRATNNRALHVNVRDASGNQLLATTGIGAGGAGIPRVTVSNDSQVQIWDGTTGPVATKAANTPPVLADKSHVHSISPNNTGLPVNTPSIVQKTNNKSSGSVASLALAFGSNNISGNSIVVVCAVGNGTAPTISDTAGNTYTQAAQIANGTALNTAVFYAVNVAAGANTVTVNNGGTTASIAMEIYEVSGLITQMTAQPSITATAQGSSGTAATANISAISPNEYAFASVGVGTAAQTITAGSGWTNDSGQQNPTTPAGLFSFISMSEYLGSLKSVTPQATFTSEPWAIAVATFRPVILGIEGTVNHTGAANGTKASVASSASSVTILAANTSRKGAMVYNDSTQILYLDLTGGTASNSSYSVQVPANGFFELPGPSIYSGLITGIWASATGNARVTEFS